MAVENHGVLYDIVDEVGIDADRFRLAQGASKERLYLTGIELAIAGAAWIGARFLRGFLKGLQRGAEEQGLDPAQIGERLGRWTSKELSDRVSALDERARQLMTSSPAEVREQSAGIDTEIEELLSVPAAADAQLPEPLRRSAVGDGYDEVVALLVENGFDPSRASLVAERVIGRIPLASAQSTQS